MNASVVTGVIAAGGDLTLMARMLGQNGQRMTQASLSAIAWQATDLAAGTIAGSGTFAIGSAIFDGLQQNDPRWTADSAVQPGIDGEWGYNFLAKLPAGTLPIQAPSGSALNVSATKTYQIDVKFTGTDGSVGYAVFQVQAIPVYF